MDVITNLPVVGGYNLVLVMVDHFTKMTHFALCAKPIFGEETIALFFKHMVRLHGIPKDITSDRGP
jgi:hypothetical protein